MTFLASIAAWFVRSKVGRAIAAAAGLVVAIGIAALRVFNAGKSSERVRQDRQSLENLRDRARIEDEVDNLPPGDVERRLSRWVRPSERR
ncbi:hypothetical protein AFEL58S_01984 [Afipia felis]